MRRPDMLDLAEFALYPVRVLRYVLAGLIWMGGRIVAILDDVDED